MSARGEFSDFTPLYCLEFPSVFTLHWSDIKTRELRVEVKDPGITFYTKAYTSAYVWTLALAAEPDSRRILSGTCRDSYLTVSSGV